ncbi:MAG: transcription elongation factor GreA [Candidatus Gottesmanbacteria bacterium]
MKVFVPKPKQIPFTTTGYQQLLDEKKKLIGERPDAVEHLRKAREMGDLSENGYYKASRARLSSLDARLRHLERLIRFGKIVESAHTGFVDIGSTVTISDGQKEMTYTIVGGYESDPKQHTISYLSPIGKSLMGKQQGDAITVTIPSGTVRYRILLLQ